VGHTASDPFPAAVGHTASDTAAGDSASDTAAAGTGHPGASPATIPPTRRARAHRRRLTRAFAWVGNIGVIIILFAAYQLWGTAVLEHHSQSQLALQFKKATGTTPSDDRPFGLLASNRRAPAPPEGSVTAQLRIPAIGVDQFVVEGTSTGDLEKGPGHYRGTAVPGQAGNVAVAGHRTTFGAPFNRLDELGPGDRITLTTTAGETLTYTVSRLPRIVSSSNVAVLNDFGDDRLTLTSSNPKYSAAERLVVVAVLDQPSPTAPGSSTASVPPPEAGPPPGRVADPQTTGWNLHRLGPAGAIAALLLLLALAYRRPSRGRRLLTVLILGPVWIAGLALLFVALTNVLPPTL
jgi:sortase A